MKNNKMKVTLYGKSLQETCFTVIQQVIDILATHCSWVYVYQPFYESIKNDFNFPANFRATNSEGVEKDTSRSLYRRVLQKIKLKDGRSARAYVYVFNQFIPLSCVEIVGHYRNYVNGCERKV